MFTDRPLRRLADLLSARSEEELSSHFETAVDELGGTGFVVAHYPKHETGIVQSLGAGMEGWVEYYNESGLIPTCPLAEAIKTRREPFGFLDIQAEAEELSKDVRVFAAAEAFRLVNGFYLPIATREGARGCVFIKLPRQPAEDFSSALVAGIAVAVHSRIEELYASNQADDAALTKRELEILRWFAEGKSAEDVATILKLSVPTIMFHYRRVSDRYGTLNRTHTVVEAIRRGAPILG